MDEFQTHLRTGSRFTMLFLSLCLVGWALLPSYRFHISGLIVGTVASWVNSQVLAWKVTRLGQTAVEQSGKRVNLGFLTRAAVAVLAVVIAQRYGFGIGATVAGLFVAQVIAFLVGAFTTWRNSK